MAIHNNNNNNKGRTRRDLWLARTQRMGYEALDADVFEQTLPLRKRSSSLNLRSAALIIQEA